jgi:hypothetical protein
MLKLVPSIYKIITVAFAMVATIILSPLMVSAHTSESNGAIGAVLHISPNDDPVVGEPAELFFDFRDKETKFKGQDCDCTVNIIRQGQTMFTAKLFTQSEYTDPNTPVLQYAFPYLSAYTIEVVGQPKVPNSFQPFKLSYNIRVDEPGTPSSAANLRNSNGNTHNTHNTNNLHWAHYTIFGAGFLVIIVYYIRERKKLKKSKVPIKPA